MHIMHVCMYACMHVCMHACMHGCMYACMHACMYVKNSISRCIIICKHKSIQSSEPEMNLRPSSLLLQVLGEICGHSAALVAEGLLIHADAGKHAALFGIAGEAILSQIWLCHEMSMTLVEWWIQKCRIRPFLVDFSWPMSTFSIYKELNSMNCELQSGWFCCFTCFL